MKPISFNNNPDPIENSNTAGLSKKHTPSYLAKQDRADQVTFSGKKGSVKKNGFRAALIALASSLLLTLGGCGGSTKKAEAPTTDNDTVYAQELEDDDKNQPVGTQETRKGVELLDIDSAPAVTVFSIEENNNYSDKPTENKTLTNVLSIVDEIAPEELKTNFITKVTKASTGEVDECVTLAESIEKQWTPRIDGELVPLEDYEIYDIANETIENNKDMQEKIAEHFGVEDWTEADIDEVLEANLFEMGVKNFESPKEITIKAISHDETAYLKKSAAGVVTYSTDKESITLDNSIESKEDLFKVFSDAYVDKEGNNAPGTAGSVAIWLAIRNNQYDEKFVDQINNDKDRVVDMLLDTVKNLKDGEEIELKLDPNFAIDYTTSGNVKEVDGTKFYNIVSDFSASETSFTLDADKQVMSSEETPNVYNFMDVLTHYYDTDIKGEKIATKEEVKNKDGSKSYILTFNENIPDINAKVYSIAKQIAFDNINFFAAKQDLYEDGELKTFEFGVFDVAEEHREDVKNALENNNFEGAVKYLEFNLDRFKNNSFYNEDGTLKTSDDLTITVPQWLYVNSGDGQAIKTDVPAPKIELEEQPDTDLGPEPDPEPDPGPGPLEDDSDIDTDTEPPVPSSDTDTEPDSNPDSDNPNPEKPIPTSDTTPDPSSEPDTEDPSDTTPSSEPSSEIPDTEEPSSDIPDTESDTTPDTECEDEDEDVPPDSGHRDNITTPEPEPSPAPDATDDELDDFQFDIDSKTHVSIENGEVIVSVDKTQEAEEEAKAEIEQEAQEKAEEAARAEEEAEDEDVPLG